MPSDTPAPSPSKRTNAAKVRRDAADPDRPGEGCKAEAGVFARIVDHARCEGKGDCVEVCPYDVFEVERIAAADYRALPWTARPKVRVHGMQTAYTPRADLCLACGLWRVRR
jgi:NAD-dependent dihydropyrimidine dehydrogenase PreA subunit